MRQTWIREASARLGDLLVIGFVTIVASLPILTVVAALSAGAAAARQRDGLRAALRSFWATFRTLLRPGLPMSAAAATVLLLGIGDIQIAMALSEEWARTASMSIGLLLAAATVGLLPYVAVMVSEARRTFRRTLFSAVRLALITPGSLAIFLTTSGLIAVTLIVLPVLVIPLTALLVSQMTRVEHRVARRIARAAMSQRIA
jgi:hypothetical protein